MPGINIVTSVLSLADRTSEKAFLDSGNLDVGLFFFGNFIIFSHAAYFLTRLYKFEHYYYLTTYNMHYSTSLIIQRTNRKKSYFIIHKHTHTHTHT